MAGKSFHTVTRRFAEAINTELDPLPESLTRLNPTLFRALPVCSGSARAS
jgi:hypothetical protein